MTDIESVDIQTLKFHPDNPRKGDVDVIAESLFANGQIAPIVVQRSTRHIVGGNHTVKAARSLGWETIEVVWRDIDDAQARRELAVLNRAGDLAGYNDDALIDLLKSFEGDFTGTGYDDEALSDLLDALDDTPSEEGDAEVEDNPTTFGIVVDCDNEKQQMALLERFLEEGLNVRSLS